MYQGEERAPLPPPSDPRGFEKGRGLGSQRVKRLATERYDRPRLEKFELPEKVRATRRSGRRVEPIPRRPALEQVEHPVRFGSEPHRGARLLETLARTPDEGESSGVLLSARRFSDEDDAWVATPSVDDGVRAAPPQPTQRARPDLLREYFPRVPGSCCPTKARTRVTAGRAHGFDARSRSHRGDLK